MIKIRNEIGEYPCYLCDVMCKSRQGLAAHTNKEHSGEDSLICLYCSAKLKDVSSVRRHIRTVHNQIRQFMCSYCNKRYKHKYDLEKHFQRVHKSGKGTDILTGKSHCSECNLLCSSEDQLRLHYLDAHGKTIQHLKCPQCMKIFFDMTYLKQHFKRVHNNPITSVELSLCEECGCVFDDEETMLLHKRERHTKSWISRHSDDESNIQASRNRTESGESVSSGFCNFCPVEECGKSFISLSKYEMVTHLIDVHRWRSVMECRKCKSLFSTSAEVQEHLNSHCLEDVDAPMLPSGKQSILKKRLLKRKNIRNLTDDLGPRFCISKQHQSKFHPQETSSSSPAKRRKRGSNSEYHCYLDGSTDHEDAEGDEEHEKRVDRSPPEPAKRQSRSRRRELPPPDMCEDPNSRRSFFRVVI